VNDEFRDDTYDFIDERGFQLVRRRIFAADGFYAEWVRGELILEIRRGEGERDLVIGFRDGKGGAYTSMWALLWHLGIEPRPLSAPIEVLRTYISSFLAHYTYSFLVDRGFQLASNDNRGGGSSTLMFRRGDLDLRIDVKRGEERIDLNGVPLADVLGAQGIKGASFADLRKHIDLILASFVVVTLT
jgi:hypothetical protein